MGRTLRIAMIVVTGLLLTGCLSAEPKVAEVEQVAAVQREQIEATEAAAGEGGGEGEGAAGGATAEFVAIDLAYEAAPTEVAAGTVEFALDNQGAIEHNVVIEELDDEVVVEAPGGGTDTGTVELEPGEYTYYCDIAGHRAAGMEGTLTVTE